MMNYSDDNYYDFTAWLLCLIGGLEDALFSPIVGMMIQSD